MKKLLLLAALIALPSMMMAQGSVRFVNFTTPDTRITTNNLAGGVGFTDGLNQWKIGLYLAPNGTTDPSAFTLVATATNRTGAFLGLFNGGDPLALPGGYPAGTQIAFQIRGWNFAAASYEEAALSPTGWVGQSPIGFVTPASSAGPFPALFGTGAGQVGGFQITPVPEPSSIALGLLGLGAIALFRRRK